MNLSLAQKLLQLSSNSEENIFRAKIPYSHYSITPLALKFPVKYPSEMFLNCIRLVEAPEQVQIFAE